MPPTKELDILLRFLTDSKTDTELALATDSIVKHFKNVEEEINAVKARARELRASARDLAQTSQELVVIGTALAGGIFAAGAKYVKDAKSATTVTVAWKAAQEELNQAGERFGAVAATVA